jgi:hypothetical protein
MKRGSRLAKQGNGVGARFPDREAGREPDLDGGARKRKPLAQRHSYPVQPGHSLLASVHEASDGKLVAPGSRDQVRAKSVQPLCRLPQKTVADVESIAGVYVLKLCHVDLDYDGQLHRARRQRIKPLHKSIAVQAAGELIVVLGSIDSASLFELTRDPRVRREIVQCGQ